MDKLHADVASSSHTHFFSRKGLTFPNLFGTIMKLKGHSNHRPAKKARKKEISLVFI